MFRLSLFGPFSLTDSNGAEVPLASKKAKALLAYLAQTPGKPRSREEILALLWSDREEIQGRASLRQVLTGLRKVVGEELLRIDRDSVALDADLVELTATDGDEFLLGFHLADPAFEEWLRDERLRSENDDLADGQAPKNNSVDQRDKPSIAVLPFHNLSGDPEQEFFSDGITEDIITELNRNQSLFVITSASSFNLRGSDIDPVIAGKELGVVYLVQGSVRRAGNRIRISTQLVDTKTSGHLWSDRFDREMSDIFLLQDEIAATVATMVSGHVDTASGIRSQRKHPADINAYELVCRADWYSYQDFRYEEISKLLYKAVGLDPGYAQAHAQIAMYEAYRIFLDALNPRDVVQTVKRHAALAAQLAPRDAMVHAPLAEAYVLLGEHELAAYHKDKALSLNPNVFRVIQHCAETAALLGDTETALDLIEKAMLRDPFGSLSFREVNFDTYFLAGRYEDALAQLIGWPDPPLHMNLSKVAALAQLGRISEARDVVQEIEVKRPEAWDVSEVLQSYYRICAKPEDGERWLEGFRMAGLEL